MPSGPPNRVLIVGGGFAGLQTAHTILRLAPDLKPVILEARTRLGGRAFTHAAGTQRPVDLGASFVHGWDVGNPMRDRIEELGGSVHIVQGKDAFVVSKDGQLEAAAASPLTSAFSSASRSLRSALCPQDCPADRNLESSVASVTSDPAVRSLLRTTEIGAGVALSRVSARYFTHPRPFAGLDAAPVGGYAAVVAAMWRQLESRGAEVVYGAEVREVTRTDDDVLVSADLAGSAQTFRAAYAVCTIPLGVLRASPPVFSPPLEPATQAAIRRTEVGLLNKVLLAYDRPWWPRPSEAAKYLVLPEVEDQPTTGSETLEEVLGKITLSVDNMYASAPREGWAALLVPLGAAGAWAIESVQSNDAVGRALHGYLARRLGTPDAPTGPEAVVVTRWASDPFARGATSAPVCVPAPSAGEGAVAPSPLDFIQMGRPDWGGRLGFAGEHTDPDHRGSVAGALISGEREGQRISKDWILRSRVIAERG